MKHSREPCQTKGGFRRSRFAESHHDVFPLHMLKLEVQHVVEGIEEIKPDNQRGNGEPHTERRDECLDRTALKAAEDHAHCRRANSIQTYSCCPAKLILRWRLWTHSFGRGTVHRSSHR